MNIGSLFPAVQAAKPEPTTAREQRQQTLADAKLNDARAAVESLKQRTSSASEEKKAAGKKKIEQIKARLQMLQMAMIGDPKGAARMAAQLAKELGAAVKAYAAAGGSTAGMGAASAPSVAAGGEPTEAAPGGATEAEAQPTMTEEAGADEGTETAKPSNPYQQAVDAAQARMAEQARRSGERQADRETLDEVKRLAAQIKALARQAANKSAPEADEADRAVAHMDREISAAVQALPNAGFVLTI